MIGNKPYLFGLNNTSAVSEEKKYIVNLSQINNENPIATVLKNDLGFSIEWQRIDDNLFRGYAPFKFTPNRTKLLINKPEETTKIYRKSTSEIYIETPDDSLQETTVEIQIIEANGLFSEEFNEVFN